MHQSSHLISQYLASLKHSPPGIFIVCKRFSELNNFTAPATEREKGVVIVTRVKLLIYFSAQILGLEVKVCQIL